MANKKMNDVEIGAYSFVGGFMLSALGVPYLPIALHVIGAGSMVSGLFKPKNKHQKLFNALGLYAGDDEKHYPVVKDIRVTSYGESIRLSVPVGLCSKDFLKHDVALKEHFRAKEIEVKFNNGYIFLHLYKDKLESMYDYTDIETKGILEVPIAYSTTGLETIDIAKGPHVLIAGETGSGKSTALRDIITYLIQNKSKYGVELDLGDLKEGVELSIFRKCKSVKTFAKDKEEVKSMLTVLLKEVKRRYKLLFDNDCVDIDEYNKKHKKNQLNYRVCVIDEFADLQSDKDSIALLEELLAKARACGVHFIISTQRPDAKVLNGRLKANVPFIIGLKTMNAVNSRIVIDQDGLEVLKGNGHTIIKTDRYIEAQCLYISKDQAKDIVKSTYSKDCDKATFQPKESKKPKTEVAEVKSFDFLDFLEDDSDD